MIDGREWDSIYADEMSRFEAIDHEKLERWAKTELINSNPIRAVPSTWDSTGATFGRYSDMNTAVDTGAQWPRYYELDTSKIDPHHDWGKYNPWRDDHGLISADAMDAMREAICELNKEYSQKNILNADLAGVEKLDEFLGEFSTEE